MTPPLARLLAWQDEGTARIESTVAGLPDTRLAEPCGLPGWQRRHLLAHLARNADALVNLLTWAATGVPTPMYTDTDQRARDIDTGAAQPPAVLRQDLLAADERYRDAVAALPEPNWAVRVRSAQGRDIPAAEVPWLRVRELWVHLVDLECGSTLADLPPDLVTALLVDATAALTRKPDAPAVHLVSDAGEWAIGADPSTTIRGTPTALLGWVTGRTPGTDLIGPLPPLPRWL